MSRQAHAAYNGITKWADALLWLTAGGEWAMIVIAGCAIAATLAFIGLVVGLLLGLRKGLIQLESLQTSADELRGQLQHTAAETVALMEPAKQSLLLVHQQLQNVQSLFTAAGQIGETIEQTTETVSRVSSMLSESAAQHMAKAETRNKAKEAMEWAELGMLAWQLWQTKRKHNG
ncbi:DUF948 domain-containing protein [Paenibacillus algorifonticola]|nr:DUF948 domain-containing protein [Paenibacillus algorifonticola]